MEFPSIDYGLWENFYHDSISHGFAEMYSRKHISENKCIITHELCMPLFYYLSQITFL